METKPQIVLKQSIDMLDKILEENLTTSEKRFPDTCILAYDGKSNIQIMACTGHNINIGILIALMMKNHKDIESPVVAVMADVIPFNKIKEILDKKYFEMEDDE